MGIRHLAEPDNVEQLSNRQYAANWVSQRLLNLLRIKGSRLRYSFGFSGEITHGLRCQLIRCKDNRRSL